jgi:hypothetical protein
LPNGQSHSCPARRRLLQLCRAHRHADTLITGLDWPFL